MMQDPRALEARCRTLIRKLESHDDLPPEAAAMFDFLDHLADRFARFGPTIPADSLAETAEQIEGDAATLATIERFIDKWELLREERAQLEDELAKREGIAAGLTDELARLKDANAKRANYAAKLEDEVARLTDEKEQYHKEIADLLKQSPAVEKKVAMYVAESAPHETDGAYHEALMAAIDKVIDESEAGTPQWQSDKSTSSSKEVHASGKGRTKAVKRKKRWRKAQNTSGRKAK